MVSEQCLVNPAPPAHSVDNHQSSTPAWLKLVRRLWGDPPQDAHDPEPVEDVYDADALARLFSSVAFVRMFTEAYDGDRILHLFVEDAFSQIGGPVPAWGVNGPYAAESEGDEPTLEEFVELFRSSTWRAAARRVDTRFGGHGHIADPTRYVRALWAYEATAVLPNAALPDPFRSRHSEERWDSFETVNDPLTGRELPNEGHAGGGDPTDG